MITKVSLTLSPEIFSLNEIKMACYTLMEKVDSEVNIDTNTGVKDIFVELKSMNHKTEGELKDDFYKELIACSVNINSLENNKELRNYIARSAFIPTTSNYDIISKLMDKKRVVINDSINSENSTSFNSYTIKEEDSHLILELKNIDFQLPIVLQICHSISDIANSEIHTEDTKRIIYIKPNSSEKSINIIRDKVNNILTGVFNITG